MDFFGGILRIFVRDYGYFCHGVMVFFIFEIRVLTFVFRLTKFTFSSDLLGEFFDGFVECQLQGTCFILMILWSAFVAVSFEGIQLKREFCRK